VERERGLTMVEKFTEEIIQDMLGRGVKSINEVRVEDGAIKATVLLNPRPVDVINIDFTLMPFVPPRPKAWFNNF